MKVDAKPREVSLGVREVYALRVRLKYSTTAPYKEVPQRVRARDANQRGKRAHDAGQDPRGIVVDKEDALYGELLRRAKRIDDSLTKGTRAFPTPDACRVTPSNRWGSTVLVIHAQSPVLQHGAS